MATGIIIVPTDLDTTSVWGMFYNPGPGPSPPPPPPLQCTLATSSAAPGFAGPGCSIPNNPLTQAFG